MEEIVGQLCQFCGKKELKLKEDEVEIPYFGLVYVLSMSCGACGYKKSDVEPAEHKEPSKYTFEVTSEDDLNVKIVKSSEAKVKIPHVITIDPGPATSGYITNVEGLLERVKNVIQATAESEDDPSTKKKAKNIIEDPTGNSIIVSDKATKGKL